MNKPNVPDKKIQHDIRTPLIIIDTALKVGSELLPDILVQIKENIDDERREKLEYFTLLISNSLKQIKKIEAILNGYDKFIVNT